MAEPGPPGVYRQWLTRRRAHPPGAGAVSRREGDAVLACAVGCDLSDVAPFIRSLRAVFSGQVILLVDRKPMLPAWLSTHGVETIVAADRLGHLAPPPDVQRFAVFAQVLRERSEIRHAILADVKEVVFQSDPLRSPPPYLTFYQASGGRAADGTISVQVAEGMVGPALTRDLLERPPIEAGVIAGPASALAQFCRGLLLLCGSQPAGPGSGVDRTACHLIAHLGLAGGEIRRNFDRVAVAGDDLTLDDGRSSNPDGSISPILLGYRRHPDLAAEVERLWGLPRRPRRLGQYLQETLRSWRGPQRWRTHRDATGMVDRDPDARRRVSTPRRTG